MSARHKSRQLAMQVLYQLDVNPGDADKTMEDFFAGQKLEPKTMAFTRELVTGTLANLPSIDDVINSSAANWNVGRMSRVDRNVIRLAVFEMLHRKDIPPVVSINEAVDVVKEFGDKDSGKFVNGVLDKIRKGLTRSARDADTGKKDEAKT